jgi:hypothetical protein
LVQIGIIDIMTRPAARPVPLLLVALAASTLAACGPASTPAPVRPSPAGTSPAPDASPAAAGLPSRSAQISRLTSALALAAGTQQYAPGGADLDDYQVGTLWRQGLDGAGTTVAVIEGWNDPDIDQEVARFDQVNGLPNPQISTIYPVGRPKTCPAGMVRLGSYGSCSAWAGELDLDVTSVHLMAPYARIVIAVAPADTESTDDAASQVAPPEMMKAVEYIASHHLANVISISDGTGESSYSHGTPEILAQNPGELAAAAAGIPVLVGTGDCGVVQNLPVANGQCEDTTTFADTAVWDDSPWVTAVGGSVPGLNASGRRIRADPLWDVNGRYGSGAGLSRIFRRPAYQDGVAARTHSAMRSVPDLVMDARDGTSESAPLLAGVLALATQLNGGDVGPINPVLYTRLGPQGTRAGIVDVVSGSNSATLPDGTVVQGYAARPGFDVASGWGTIDAARFVPSLVAATRADGEESAARRQAASELSGLEHAVTLSPVAIPAGGSAQMTAGGFLPGHPVRLSVDGRAVATLTAGPGGSVRYVLRPSALGLAAGRHVLALASMLITQTASFSS